MFEFVSRRISKIKYKEPYGLFYFYLSHNNEIHLAKHANILTNIRLSLAKFPRSAGGAGKQIASEAGKYMITYVIMLKLLAVLVPKEYFLNLVLKYNFPYFSFHS